MENKTIVITGASSGAGKATALELAPERVNLVLAARNETALLELGDECRELGADGTGTDGEVYGFIDEGVF